MAQAISKFQEATTPGPGQTVLKSDQSQKGKLNKIKLLIPLVLLVVGGGLVWKSYFAPRPVEPLRVSGRIEGYETDVGAKVGGRIAEIVVREGDRVKKGQIIARLDAAEIQAQLQGSQARIAAARQREEQARLQIDVIQTQIAEAQISLQQSQDDAAGRISQAQGGVAAAEAQLAQTVAAAKQAAAELALAQTERDRYLPLVEQGAISRQIFDQVDSRYQTALAAFQARQATITAAQRQVNIAQGALVQAETSRLNPNIRTARIAGLEKQKIQAESQVNGARLEVLNTQAQAKEILARAGDLNIISPIDGVVLTRNVEPGEVISAGKTLISVVNLNDVYLRGYIPEERIGKVRVGQKANVYLDSDPEQPLTATVSAIDTEASFTPENIYFKDDRVTQVFGLKLEIDNPGGYAKPGMPADGEIIETVPQKAGQL